MSFDATRWAWAQQGLKSSQKLVLLALADRAGDDQECYPSIARIASDTGLDRKVIMSAVTELERAELIQVVRRKGAGNVYRLLGVDRQNQSQKRHTTNTENGTGTEIGIGAKNGTASVPETVLHQSQKRDTESIKNLSTTNQKNNISASTRFVPPTIEQIRAYCSERCSSVDPDRFFDHYTSNGWKVGRNPMKDWQASVRTWERNAANYGQAQLNRPTNAADRAIDFHENMKRIARGSS